MGWDIEGWEKFTLNLENKTEPLKVSELRSDTTEAGLGDFFPVALKHGLVNCCL